MNIPVAGTNRGRGENICCAAHAKDRKEPCDCRTDGRNRALANRREGSGLSSPRTKQLPGQLESFPPGLGLGL
eukprot:8717407-Pyramimonas_sp.AAC.1